LGFDWYVGSLAMVRLSWFSVIWKIAPFGLAVQG
jgi:hypothetical protein